MDWNESASHTNRRIEALLDKHASECIELSTRLVGLPSDRVRKLLAGAYPEPPKREMSAELLERMTPEEFEPYKKRLGTMAYSKYAHCMAEILAMLPATSLQITNRLDYLTSDQVGRLRKQLIANGIIKRGAQWPKIKTYHTAR